MIDDDQVSCGVYQLKQVTLYQLVKKVEDRSSKTSPPSKTKTSSNNTPQKTSGKTPPKQTPKKTPYHLPPVVARFVDTTGQLIYCDVCKVTSLSSVI